jgi:hypothetical protein
MSGEDFIVFGFSTSSKWWSPVAWGIRLVERTPYSHVYMKFWSDSLQRWLIYHASQRDLHFNNLEMFEQYNRVLKEYKVFASKKDRTEGLQLCVDRVGWAYGRMQLVGMAAVRVVKAWFGWKVKNPFADAEKTQVCSEIAGRVLKIVGGPIDVSALEYEGPRYIYDAIQKMVAAGTASEI